VVLAAALHSEGSVSSPTSRIYPPGKELVVIGRADGWFQVSDPVTQERGWIFKKYLSSASKPRWIQRLRSPYKLSQPCKKQRSISDLPSLRFRAIG
jgi:hypothetical protein